MNSILRHLLLLVACMLLAPPPGWCCLVPVRTQHKSETLAKAEPCCPACATHAPNEKPDEDHSVPPRSWCCCEPNVLASTQRVSAPDLDLTPALVPVVATADGLASQAPAPVAAPLPPSRPLHLLCSVWLC
jgi:hypothetical protein